jgi:hypothetical protein
MERRDLEPTVTVLLVTHNSSKYLPSLWGDLAAQTSNDFEVLVVDNASSDQSLEFVREHALKVAVRALPQTENLGVTGAWKVGLKEVRSRWVMLVSPDCRFPADLVSGLTKRAELAGKAIGRPDRVGGITPLLSWKGGPGAPKALPPHFHLRQKGLPQGVAENGETFGYHGACTLLSTDMLKDVGGFDTHLFFGGDEADTALRAHLRGWRFFAATEISVEHPYEVRPGSKTGRTLLLRTTSFWYFLLKHVGITLSWGTLPKEMIDHLFWQRHLSSPGFILSEMVWFVRSVPDIRVARLEMHRQWDNRVESNK